jgi:hypothetical protein
MKYVGLDWAYRRAQWCALSPGGQIAGEGQIPADRDGLARLVLELGAEVKACLEMMSGALWVRDQLVACGWQVEVADARRVKTVAPLAAKTDKVDARLLAELSRRELVPALWLPSLDERALRERLRGEADARDEADEQQHRLQTVHPPERVREVDAEPRVLSCAPGRRPLPGDRDDARDEQGTADQHHNRPRLSHVDVTFPRPGSASGPGLLTLFRSRRMRGACHIAVPVKTSTGRTMNRTASWSCVSRGAYR